MRYELKSISLWAFVKVSFFLNIIVGFIVGLLYALFFGVFMTILSRIPGMASSEFDSKSLPVGFLIIILPILFAVLGAFFNTVFGAIIVFIYNMIARIVGGMELDFQPVQEAMPSSPQAPSYAAPVYPSAPQATYSAPPPPPPYPPVPPEPPKPPSDPTQGGGI